MRRWGRLGRTGAIGLVIILASVMVGAPMSAAVPTVSDQVQSLDWIEPRALNIFDIAGQVPDHVLQGHIVSYASGGIATYDWGTRVGDVVTIQLSHYGLWYGPDSAIYTIFSLPSMPGNFDHMGSVAPACTARFYAHGADITASVTHLNYYEPAMVQPSQGASSNDRYPELFHDWQKTTVGANGIEIPATYGGVLLAQGQHNVIVGVYTAYLPDSPRVDLVGTQNATFQSYIGTGGVGVFQNLLGQMRDRYGDRHPRIMMQKPASANYIMFDYPPMPYNAYGEPERNIQRPVGGTVRLAPDQGMLSADLVFGGAFPLNSAWQDADQSAGPMLSPLPPCDRVTPPEFVLPAGMPWNDCYLRGNCSNSVLADIYGRVMPIELIYLQVVPRSDAVQAVHLEMVDETWHGRSLHAQAHAEVEPTIWPVPNETLPSDDAGDDRPSAWVPYVRNDPAPTLVPTPAATPTVRPSATPSLPDAQRPCGYFSNGRMIGYAQ